MVSHKKSHKIQIRKYCLKIYVDCRKLMCYFPGNRHKKSTKIPINENQ